MTDDIAPDSAREWTAWMLAFPLVVFIVSSVFFTVFPNVAWNIAATGQHVFSPQDNTSEELHLPVEERDYLNRQYTELNTRRGDNVGETIFCVKRDNDKLSVQKAGVLQASEQSVTFTTQNCVGDIIGTLHFHPPWSTAELSTPDTSLQHTNASDTQQLLQSPYSISCVQARTIQAGVNETTVNMQCFSDENVSSPSDTFPKVNVVVSE